MAASDPPHVLPPGQEDAVANMLGRGATLGGGCVWSGASIDRTFIRSEYTCGEQKFSLTLRHPDDQPQLTRRSERFAFDADGSTPAALLDDVFARVKAQEESVRWDAAAGPPPAPLQARPFPTSVALSLAGIVLLASVLAFTARFIATRRKLAERTKGFVAVTLTSIFAAAGFGTLRAALELGALLILQASRVEHPELALLRDACLGVLLLALAPAWMKNFGGRLCAAVVTVMLCITWVSSTRGAPLTMFGSMSTLSTDVAPYPLNARGFRGPDFALEKSPGVTRIAVIGDSFVQGDGISDESQTLTMQLQRELARRRPEARVEVLNLAIAGNNLGSHVTMVEEAKQVQPDVIVLCLTLNNDLSPIDGQVLRSSARRLSFFSFARSLFGDATNLAVLRATLPGQTLTARELDFTQAQAERLSRTTTPLVVFSFHRPEEAVRQRFTQPLVFPPSVEATDFIPGDGHPTASGAGRFAVMISDALEPVLGWR
ncbi:MAG: SGNH/GDSL hydrolase family protein [Archangium sp.]